MKTRLACLAILLACCVAGTACVTVAPRPAYTPRPAPVVVPSGAEGEPFYDELVPYGQWVYVSGPGWAWSPDGVPAGWRPYEMGHWVYTDYGWTWASDEEFGWAVYHYGRWHVDPEYGWVWVPGTEWGPAWVAWHEGGGWVGWAPLPYQVHWRAGVGLDWGGVNVNVALAPSSWFFVQARYMVEPDIRHRCVPPSRNVTLIQNTHHVTHYVTVDNRIVDRSVQVEKINRAVGHPVPRYQVRHEDSPGIDRGGKVKGQDFVVFRPNPGRGVRSHGSPDPPGQQEERGRAGDRRGEGTQRDAPAREARPETAAPQPGPERRGEDAGQRPARNRKGRLQPPDRSSAPSRTPAETSPGRPAGQDSPGPPAEASPARPAAPDQGARPEERSRGGNAGREPAGRGNNTTPSNRPGSSDTAPGKPDQVKTQGAGEPPATAGPSRTGRQDGKAAAPGKAGTQPGKAKGKKGAPAASKSGKAKSPAPDDGEQPKDKPKPEESGPADQK